MIKLLNNLLELLNNITLVTAEVKINLHLKSRVLITCYEETRRERLKSALYLRLKKRKTFLFGKKLEIFEKKFLSENVAQCRKM